MPVTFGTNLFPEVLLADRTRRDVIIIAAFTAVVVSAIVIGVRADWLSLGHLWSLVLRLREARGTGAIYAVLFIGVAAAGLPITPFILIGGVLFGLWMGTLISWGSAVVGAAAGYYLARRVGGNSLRRVIERFAGHDVRFTGKGAQSALFRLRLMPLTPFGALNFAAGLGGMPFGNFLIATAFGILPSVAIMTYFASAVLAGGQTARTAAIVRTIVAALAFWALSYAPRLWDRFTRR